MKNTFTFLITLLIAMNGFAQDPAFDSLKMLLENCPEDTNKLKILENLADIAPDGEWQKYSEQMEVLAKKFMKSPNTLIQLAGKRYYSVSINNKAYEYAEKGDYKTALDYFEQCIKIDREIKDDKNIGLVLSSIGAIYDRQNDMASAIKIYREALVFEKKVGNAKDMVATLTNLGVLYGKKNISDSSLSFFLEALELVNSNMLKDHNANILLSNLGDAMAKKNLNKKAMEYYNRGLKISEETGDKSGESVNLDGIAKIFFNQGKTKEALNYAKKHFLYPYNKVT